jgi:hypothetical protein
VDDKARFEVVSLEKTNGQSLEVAGAKSYKLFYRATVNFPNGFRPECAPSGGGGGYNCALFRMDRQGRLAPQPMRAQTVFEGEVLYQQLEKGWSPQSLELRQISVIELPPSEAEKAEYQKQVQSEIQAAIASCSHLIDEARYAAMKGKPDATGYQPDFNKVTLKRNGEVWWNSVPVDDVTLQQYLERTLQQNPMPYLVLAVESGVGQPKVDAIRTTLFRTGVCAGE